LVTSPDHPELLLVQARYYTKGRADGPPLWIVIHDMEASETRTRAEDTAQYFATMPDGRQVSSHYTADNDSIVACVRLGDVAWTVGNRPGNYRGINWELSGFASQTRAQWLDDFGRAMLNRIAPYIRSDAARFSIPLRRCSVADLQAFRPGITCHNDLRLAFGGTTHTDPGPNFPWDYLFAALLETPQEDNDMAQMLVRFTDDPVEPNQVWLCDGQFRRRVKPEWVGLNGKGPITNAQVHGPTLLGPLGNNGAVFASLGDKDVWGIDIATLQGGGTGVSGPVELTDASVDRVAEAVADEAHNRLAE
jgi:hypothetical protein